MIKRLIVVMMAVALSAAAAQAAINATGDVTPPDPATWTSTTQASVGNTGYGSLTVDDGSGVLSDRASIGREAGSTGDATISGAGSTWADSYQISVGTYGDGTLNILDGAAVSSKKGSIAWLSAQSAGALVVDGPGSTWTYTMWFMVGGLGHGTMSITNGGAVRAPLEDYSEGIVGYALGSGAATVDGAGSMWEAERIMVGVNGYGTLDITNGGLVNSISGGIGVTFPEAPGVGLGIVTVDGAGSAWTSDGLSVRNGELNITGGGEVTVGSNTHVASTAPDGPPATSEIDFDNGTLTTGALFSAVTDLNGTGTINAKGLVTDADLVFDATHGLTQVLTFNGPGQNVTVNLDVDGTAAMGAGHSGSGSMHIADGVTVQSLSGYVGYSAGADGVVTVDGAGSTWANSSYLYVAYYGDGTLTITGGGAVSSATGNIGFWPDQAGVVTVDGAGSTWTNTGDLNVGQHGNGTLNVTNGGAVVSEAARIARYHGNGEATVSGADSTLTCSDRIIVGYSGDGVLNVTGGGAVSGYRGYVGYNSSSTGVATVDGAGSKWTNSEDLYVGFNGGGTLSITRGGLVSVGDTLRIDYAGEGGLINMATGGMLALWGDADDSLASFLGLVGGTDDIRYGDIDILDWDTTGLDYDLSYQTGGDLAGYTMLTMSSGWGDFDLDADVDDLDIDALADAIRLGLTETVYDLSGAGEDGTPDGVIDINDLDYLVHQLVETTIDVGSEYGDFNLDGLVDTTDLTRLATDYGTGDTWVKGNANRNIDLITDTTDLTILATYYGFGAPDAVPEPATLSLLAIGAAAALARRRR